MRLTITMDMDNSAFDQGRDESGDYVEGFEAARILRKIADSLADGSALRPKMRESFADANGNRVCELSVR